MGDYVAGQAHTGVQRGGYCERNEGQKSGELNEFHGGGARENQLDVKWEESIPHFIPAVTLQSHTRMGNISLSGNEPMLRMDSDMVFHSSSVQDVFQLLDPPVITGGDI